ncbi:MAG TPA: c-type cytochrome [Terriglobia bacterium]|nr:c-type cytochrome [Terriglobia bacterium]
MRCGPPQDDRIALRKVLGTSIRRHLAGVGGLILLLFLVIPVLTSTAASRNTDPADTGLAQGKQSFVLHCGGCHGMDGRGGEHAPDIATSPIVQAFSEADLELIVTNGIPSHGMPGFNNLGPAGIKAVVEYLLILQGKQSTAAVRGNPAQGKHLFFGRAQCSSCHMVHGKGGFLGADLTEYSRTHSPQEMKEAIVNPYKNLSPRQDTVVAVTRDGQKLTGIARNEDNFSVQLQTADGAFHLLMKSNLAALHHGPRSLMPSDYASKLSASEIDDLISFLAETGETSETKKSGGNRSN